MTIHLRPINFIIKEPIWDKSIDHISGLHCNTQNDLVQIFLTFTEPICCSSNWQFAKQMASMASTIKTLNNFMGLSIYGHFPILLRRERRFAAKKTEKPKVNVYLGNRTESNEC